MLTGFAFFFPRFAFFYETNYVSIGNFCFNSIGDIIDHYRKEQIVEGYYLKEPVPMQVSVVFFIVTLSILFQNAIWWYVYIHTHALKLDKI